MAEYNHGRPCALVEYKHRKARRPDLRHPTYQTLIALADGYIDGPLPCFIAFYDDETWAFSVIPLNASAQEIYGHRANAWMTEQDFVESLYLLRKLTLSDLDRRAIDALNAKLPSAPSWAAV